MRKKKLVGVVFVTASLLLFFLFRNSLLRYAFEKVQKRVFDTYQWQLSVASLNFSGFDNVQIENLVIQPNHADTLLRIKNTCLNLSVFHLLQGEVAFDEIEGDSILFSIYNSSKRCNIKTSGKDERPEKTKTSTGQNDFYELSKSAQRKLLLLFNTIFNVNNIQVIYSDSLLTEYIQIPRIRYDSKLLTGKLISLTNADTLLFEGKAVEKNKDYQLTITHTAKQKGNFPLSGSELGLKYNFTSLTASLKFEQLEEHLSMATEVTLKDLMVHHWRLSNENVKIPSATLKGIFYFSANSIELDSASYVLVQHTKANLFANYTTKPAATFTCSLHMPETVADTFFHSLPDGVFSTLKGISCSGSLSYRLFFSIPLQQPDSLVFESEMKRKNFGIRHFGAENYARINGPFTYEAYDKDRLVRLMEVSPANPMFTPLTRISPYLINSVLQSEDPSFMQHRGFLQESFRESIVKNYKEKRFARGGSTISMQLAKNVFLNRNKTVSRKAEEVLIVYLIENLGLVSKERMLEIYLNVIEWGPNVYGIGEASRFYFTKNPSQLTLQESIFLAGIIPAPKYFKYQFDKQGQLKKYLSGYFKILSGRMVYKGRISPSDTIGLTTHVKLTGPALRMVVPNDTLLPNLYEENLSPED